MCVYIYIYIYIYIYELINIRRMPPLNCCQKTMAFRWWLRRTWQDLVIFHLGGSVIPVIQKRAVVANVYDSEGWEKSRFLWHNWCGVNKLEFLSLNSHEITREIECNEASFGYLRKHHTFFDKSKMKSHWKIPWHFPWSSPKKKTYWNLAQSSNPISSHCPNCLYPKCEPWCWNIYLHLPHIYGPVM